MAFPPGIAGTSETKRARPLSCLGAARGLPGAHSRIAAPGPVMALPGTARLKRPQALNPQEPAPARSAAADGPVLGVDRGAAAVHRYGHHAHRPTGSVSRSPIAAVSCAI